jgi:hypothetical protein
MQVHLIWKNLDQNYTSQCGDFNNFTYLKVYNFNLNKVAIWSMLFQSSEPS